MRLGYVKSAFRNVDATDKHEKIKVIDLGENSMCRVLFVDYFPAAIKLASAANSHSSLDVYSGDPDSGGSIVLRNLISSTPFYSSTYNFMQRVNNPRFPSPGVIFDDDVWVKSPDTDLTDPTSAAVGINFVSIIYQVGTQGS
tara:strand:+ start:485 stop:910 length:426 start_codon:yes stop_codon:yes gene_type:complete